VRGALCHADSPTAVVRIAHPSRRVRVITAAVPQQPQPTRHAEALSRSPQAVAVVAAKLDDRADAERGSTLPEARRLVDVVSGEIHEHRRTEDGRAQPWSAHRVAVVP